MCACNFWGGRDRIPGLTGQPVQPFLANSKPVRGPVSKDKSGWCLRNDTGDCKSPCTFIDMKIHMLNTHAHTSHTHHTSLETMLEEEEIWKAWLSSLCVTPGLCHPVSQCVTPTTFIPYMHAHGPNIPRPLLHCMQNCRRELTYSRLVEASFC